MTMELHLACMHVETSNKNCIDVNGTMCIMHENGNDI